MPRNKPADKMSSAENQKSKRCKIDDFIHEKLSGEMLKDFEALLEFLKQEKITCPWARFGWEGIHTFHMKHKGKNIGEVSFLGENHIRIQVSTNEWKVENFDLYLDGQPNEVVDMLMERAAYECTKCCQNICSAGLNVEIAGKRYANRCMNMSGYRFVGDSMREFTLYSPRTVSEPVGLIPLESIKKLIVAKKEHIIKQSLYQA